MIDKIPQLFERFEQFPFIQEGWLFGSHAYGKPNQYSDIDICVVVDDGSITNENFGDVKFDISNFLSYSTDVDLIMIEKSKLLECKNRKDLVYFDIFHMGKRMYLAEDLHS